MFISTLRIYHDSMCGQPTRAFGPMAQTFEVPSIAYTTGATDAVYRPTTGGSEPIIAYARPWQTCQDGPCESSGCL